MKKTYLLLSLFMIIGLVIFSFWENPKTEFTKQSLENKMLAFDNSEIAFKDILKKYKGKTIVIDVWASWCRDCVGGMPKVKELQNANPDVVYLFLSMDKSYDKWKLGIEKYDVQGEHYLVTDGMQGVFGQSIDLNWIPRYMIVDKTGKIALYKAIEADDEKITATLKKIK
ncbi:MULTISPECIES: TlpA family protein disulfide reductase [unclassified Flavobacterium]|uniref:TlpA family protein disulfide reductase n=1 Tax=Flavobacterium sp. GT3R68 TaxID=2594437 RepID=UPI000F89B6AA|nr:redoxin domain-containing protein [Flavobacterium sp. GSN2]TRW90085.1 redoxin domain-containing protein [Flavobacterium sp. GT3R68]